MTDLSCRLEAGINEVVFNDMAGLGFFVDFQCEIRNGDKFEMMYAIDRPSGNIVGALENMWPFNKGDQLSAAIKC